MFWRSLREEDLPICLEIDSRHFGHEIVGKELALRAWAWMMRSGSFQSAVIEANPPIAGHRIVVFASSVFVDRDFAERELAEPRPGLNARLIASIDAGRPVVLSPDQLRSANTEGGLDLIVLCPQIRRSILNSDQLHEAEMYISSTFLQAHAGFRLRRIISEAVDDYEKRHFVEPTGIGKIVSDFREFYARHPATPWSRDRSLAVVTIEHAFRVAGHVATILFQYREPSLGLLDSQQEVLNAALTGLTDEELGERLGIRLPTVKRRWRSIFERMSAHPDLFPAMSDGLDDGSRGRQKRHRILAYVREHPEELRPFDAKVVQARGNGAGRH